MRQLTSYFNKVDSINVSELVYMQRAIIVDSTGNIHLFAKDTLPDSLKCQNPEHAGCRRRGIRARFIHRGKPLSTQVKGACHTDPPIRLYVQKLDTLELAPKKIINLVNRQTAKKILQ
ncbi:hypothetical protein I8H84_01555 [Candidatus Saccharibacteria bacterium]|nr:hypothetical protein [Candidatus Saccharibacteria bacterium]MBH1972633.1 hypothetical protein [Candidatus Saccharibacteria bacterium]MBH1990835.1 hypothetical protein [Candidatus Saccharibacteria bacterium]